MLDKLSRVIAISEFDEKFDLTKILLPESLVLAYSLIAKVIHYQILFKELKSNY